MLEALYKSMSGLKTTYCEVGEIKPRWKDHGLRDGVSRRSLTHIEVDGQPLVVTPRFIKSLSKRFHLSEYFFNYFTPAEVFERIQNVHPRSRIRLVSDHDYALAVSWTSSPQINPEGLTNVLKGHEDRLVDVSYRNGVVRSTHRIQDPDWSVGGDLFSPTFTLETPVDGFGLPQVYLSMIRQVCSNGMVAMSPAFRTDIQIGRNDSAIPEVLFRALDCFNNEEGFSALKSRLDSSRVSSASVAEVRALGKAMHQDGLTPLKNGDIYTRFWKLTGDIASKYGVASSEAISEKKQRLLPMDCSVYDLFTFGSEVATHRLKGEHSRGINGWIGTTLTREYDLEGDRPDGGAPAFFLN